MLSSVFDLDCVGVISVYTGINSPTLCLQHFVQELKGDDESDFGYY